MSEDRPTAFLRDPSDQLVIGGNDALDLLQRISASDLGRLDAGSTMPALFTDEKGRLIDAPAAVQLDGAFLLVAGPTRGPALRQWIERWIITEDVTISSYEGVALGLLDDAAIDLSTKSLGMEPVAQGEFRTLADRTTLVRAVHPPGTPATLLVPPTTALPTGLDYVDLGSVRRAQIETGRVVAGPALASGPNPLEIGWRELVGWTKGCYIGQEVVARLDTYDKVGRRVARIELDRAVEAGATIRSSAKKVGMILDAVQNSALAVIDLGLEPGVTVEVGESTPGRVI